MCGTMTEILQSSAKGITRAAQLIREGELVSFGTETVYGLGADATNARAVAGIFAAKDRPRFNPLICHYPDTEAAFRDVGGNEAAWRLAEMFWPGPLTLVLPRATDCPVSDLASAGLETLAVRVPAQKVALAILRETGCPVAAPSANRSGRISPTTAQDVLAELSGRIAAVVDCGDCQVGVESTVLDLSGEQAVLLRPGGATVEAIEAVIGTIAYRPGSAVLRSPGMMRSHYAPNVPVRLNAQDVARNEGLLAFGPPLSGAGAVFNLSDSGDLSEAAARLFAGLRALDAQRLQRIAVMPIPESGLGLAINDRLRRAAAPRL
jgi:L-threonylcarbamoyladenylate synthase